MGVYIKGMEMPVIELEWTIRRGADGKWYAIDTNAETSDGEWHEIVPVPKHGDLIDRDALKPYMLNEHYKHRLVFDADEVANAPTVIEAEDTTI